jgi:hypothetical protein
MSSRGLLWTRWRILKRWGISELVERLLKSQEIPLEVWGSHGGEDVGDCLLGCNAVWSCKCIHYESTRRHNPEDQYRQTFHVFYGNLRFISVFTRTHHWALPWASWIQSTFSRPISLTWVLILPFHLRCGQTLLNLRSYLQRCEFLSVI